ncbi:MAG: transcription antitermination factor NusB [Rhodocyclaceae bacterium]|jgi:N utilization substance protein B|nr:transcription antitermination factor NusB [Rhodocyclaceae bacterium]MCL4682230.1 transcription antitermination factor NusB [Rhodocyclaceae bacterium]
MKSPRRRAREFALQGIYQWQLSGNEVPAIEAHLSGVAGFEKMDRPLFDLLLKGAIGEAAELQALIEPHLDRPYAELSPVERSILLLAVHELRHHIEAPYKVVINEAIELAKGYGGTDGHKYVNGVLDKLAAQIRPQEIVQGNRRKKSTSTQEEP